MRKKLSILVSAAFMAFMFVGCLIDGSVTHYLHIRVNQCEADQKYGLYIINDNNVVIRANELITMPENGEASFKDNIYKFDDAKNTYFLYTPYTLQIDSMPVVGDTINVKDPREFFSTLIDKIGNIKISKGVESVCGEYIEIFEMNSPY